MIRITKTNDNNLKRSHDGEWQKMDSQAALIGKVNPCGHSNTPQSDVDAIADMMDQPQTTPESSNPPIQQMGGDIKQQDITRMMQNYIKQNGGVVQDDEKPKNKVILG